MNKYFIFSVVLIIWFTGVWYVIKIIRMKGRKNKFKTQAEIRKIIATGKPFIAPPDLLPKMNRRQKRRYEKLNKHGKQK